MIKWLKEFFLGKTVEEIDKTWPLEINFDEGDTLLMHYPPNTSLKDKFEVSSFLQKQFDSYDSRKLKIIFIPRDMEVVGVIRRTQISETKPITDDSPSRDH